MITIIMINSSTKSLKTVQSSEGKLKPKPKILGYVFGHGLGMGGVANLWLIRIRIRELNKLLWN